jgi:hypothetical protein
VEREMTVLSFFLCVLPWIKYCVIPEQLRFLWWLLWVPLKKLAFAVHKYLVLQGALKGNRALQAPPEKSCVLHI